MPVAEGTRGGFEVRREREEEGLKASEDRWEVEALHRGTQLQVFRRTRILVTSDRRITTRQKWA